jgi:tetrahydromethanopterin S-methyltransferase subunit G
MDSPYHTTVVDIDSVKDCGSTYGLFVGIALALMKIRLGAGLIR